MAAVAAITERVEIGPLVACTSFHNPAMIAKKAATLEEVSVAVSSWDWAPAGTRASTRRSVIPTTTASPASRRRSPSSGASCAAKSSIFAGDYYTLDDCLIVPPGPRPEGPPLMIGSAGERMLDITMPYVQSWNAWYAWFGNRPEDLAPWMEKVDEAAGRVGRDPETVERTCAVYVGLTGGKGRHGGVDERGGCAAVDRLDG